MALILSKSEQTQNVLATKENAEHVITCIENLKSDEDGQTFNITRDDYHALLAFVKATARRLPKYATFEKDRLRAKVRSAKRRANLKSAQPANV